MHWLVGLGAGLNLIWGRHLAFYFSIYLAIGVVPFYKDALGDNILNSSTLNPTLVPSYCIFSVIGVFSVPWIIFVQYVNALALFGKLEEGSKSKGLSTFAAIIDLILGIWLWLACQWQSAYLPHKQSECGEAVTWPGPNGQVNIFQAFGFLEQEAAEDACSDLVGYWKLGLGLTVLTLFACLMEFCNGSFVGFVKLCCWFGAGIVPATKYLLTKGFPELVIYLVTKGFPKLAIFLLRLIVRLLDLLCDGFLWLATTLGLFIPRRLAPPVRYTSRYWRRSRQKQGSLPTHEFHLWRVRPSNDKRDTLEFSSKGISSIRNSVVLQKLPSQVILPAPLLRLLSRQGSDTILLRIAFFLHYNDVVKLSLLSKQFRSTLFESSTFAESLRIASCISSKSECYCCNMQICESCQVPRPLIATTTAPHLDDCVVHCSRCYRKKICAPKSIHSPPICECNLEMVKQTNLKNICNYCSALSDGGLEIRQTREKTEIRHLAGQELKCGGCKRKLPFHGVRWWVCKKCHKECTNSIHPQWAKAAEV